MDMLDEIITLKILKIEAKTGNLLLSVVGGSFITDYIIYFIIIRPLWICG